MSIYDPITNGDTAIAVVYRLTDSDGRIWRSSPYILDDCLYWNGDSTGFQNANHRIRIPTLRHLMAGTQAQIELYIGNVDLQLFQVYANDPTVHYLDVYPKLVNGATWMGTPSGFYTIEDAVNYVGVGETLYTTGEALENSPPPIARCAYSWRNRVFVANGNDIYPSQEFSEGIGVQWNDSIHMKWEDGTGDILAMAHIDWNYLAMFKRDAIGIISGPGPDGMGQGNYIVQTLSTKAGCTNVKSIINGADGLYYQDSQTGRLMLLTPNLQTQECAPGAFDYSSCTITCAAHVEQQRQLWFYAQGAQSRLIVIDYKHRTETSPFGSVYTWWVPWTVSAMYVALNGPVLVVNDGSICSQSVAQYSDVIAGVSTPASISMDMITGDMNPIGLQRQFHLSRVQFLGDYGSAHRIELDVMPDFAVRTSTHVIAMNASPEQGCARPENCMRIQSVRLRVRELINTTGTPPVPVIGPGFKFIGFALEIQDCGKIANLSTTRIA